MCRLQVLPIRRPSPELEVLALTRCDERLDRGTGAGRTRARGRRPAWSTCSAQASPARRFSPAGAWPIGPCSARTRPADACPTATPHAAPSDATCSLYFHRDGEGAPNNAGEHWRCASLGVLQRQELRNDLVCVPVFSSNEVPNPHFVVVVHSHRGDVLSIPAERNSAHGPRKDSFPTQPIKLNAGVNFPDAEHRVVTHLARSRSGFLHLSRALVGLEHS
mmetsp:Transcript_23262/g.48296  ORF Transcript_23262/g.48296 Transcript_23262/m.48296 type:complete len:220 (+) Transcript_23262:1900-2559(+)